jgi:hypothetical protein
MPKTYGVGRLSRRSQRSARRSRLSRRSRRSARSAKRTRRVTSMRRTLRRMKRSRRSARRGSRARRHYSFGGSGVGAGAGAGGGGGDVYALYNDEAFYGLLPPPLPEDKQKYFVTTDTLTVRKNGIPVAISTVERHGPLENEWDYEDVTPYYLRNGVYLKLPAGDYAIRLRVEGRVFEFKAVVTEA